MSDRNSVKVRWYAECSECERTLTRTLEKHEAETSILIRWSECGAEVPAREYTSPTTEREELVTDGGEPEWFPCDACGAEYRNRGAALACCTDAASGAAYLQEEQ